MKPEAIAHRDSYDPLRALRVAGVVLALAAGVALPARAGKAFDETYDRIVPLPSGGSFSLSNVNGTVEVLGWEREEVSVHAVKWAKNSPADLARVRIEIDGRGGSVAVRTIYPRNEDVEVNVEYRIRVPRRVLLRRVETINGDVRVRGVEGTGELRSVNGNVDLRDAGGPFSARTTNGNIRMELRSLESSAEPATLPARFVSSATPAQSVETVNGSVVIELDKRASAELEISCLNGDFRSQLPVEPQASGSPQVFRGRLGHGGAPLHIRTVNGGIRLLVARPMV